jgi:hypothetical protein
VRRAAVETITPSGRALAIVPLALALLVGCVDLRDFAGSWSGTRIGEAAPLRQGFAADATATLAIERADLQTLSARLTISGDVLQDALIQPLAGAEADVLSGIQFDGSPVRVYLAFAPAADGGGDPLVVVALYDDQRIEIRVLRGGASPLYGIFALRPTR